MADFNQAIKLLFKLEGGFVDNPKDPGGATKYGISIRFLISEGILSSDPKEYDNFDLNYVKSLTPDEASKIYQRDFWDNNNIGSISSQRIANMILCECVNLGTKMFVTIVQKAINAVNENNNISTDGVLGDITLKAINECDENKLIPQMKDKAILYYNYIAAKNKNLKEFLKGWLKRVNSF